MPKLDQHNSLVGLMLLALGLLLVGCTAHSPTLAPTPTIRPRATATPLEALDGAHFVIEYNGQPAAIESIHAEEVEQGLLVTSELQRTANGYPLERRILLLSADLAPLSYDVNIGTNADQSSWSARRVESVFTLVANALYRPGPVVIERIAPLPNLILDGTPTALPFAILALQLTINPTAGTSFAYHYLDILADLPTVLPITLTASSSTKGAFVGTNAFVSNSTLASPFTFWLRSSDRSLYTVEFDKFDFSPWETRVEPGLNQVNQVAIRRVDSIQLPEPTPALSGQSLSYVGNDSSPRNGVLYLPKSDPPYPCLVASTVGMLPVIRNVQSALDAGWAVFIYDRPSLELADAEYQRGNTGVLAMDSIKALEALRSRPDLASPFVFLGSGEGALVGAAASAQAGGFDALILANTPLLPPLSEEAEALVSARLAVWYGWDSSQTASYTRLTINRWNQWLFEGTEELVVANRSYDLRPLQALRMVQPQASLRSSTVPILVMAGEDDPWLAPGQVQAIVDEINRSAGTDISYLLVPGWDGLVNAQDGTSLLSPQADPLMWAWLVKMFGR